MNIRTSAPPIADSWTLISTLHGIQLQKNDRNICFAKSFEKAWDFVRSNGTPGDHISIQVEGTLSVS